MCQDGTLQYVEYVLHCNKIVIYFYRIQDKYTRTAVDDHWQNYRQELLSKVTESLVVWGWAA